ncbi:probable insulin-like peptide 1 [Macrosteles quadrilineatus]|uniref:probable insulin-like peptide 1 n=1 Tax=Macrosteles quadrilineatus TaxID=74068 RepID=UPI0023E253BD|nr:probable insulin-like peptide 1 [Macrosteles quadrilineatus]
MASDVALDMGRLQISFATITILLAVTVEPGTGKRLCGPALTQAMSLLCDQHDGFYGKRSNSLDTEDSEAEPHWMSEMYLDPDTEHFLTRRQAMRLIPGMQRVRRSGLADECCLKSCTVQEMTSYCATTPSDSDEP